MREKSLTSNLFKDKKESYPASVGVPFKIDRLEDHSSYKVLPSQKIDFLKSNSFFVDKSENVKVSIFNLE